MRRKIRGYLLLVGAAAMLAACGTSVVQAPTGVTGSAKKAVLATAGKRGPILLQVSAAPFKEGKGETAATSANILSGVYPEVPHGFTLDPGKAGAPQYRFRLAFDPPKSTSADQICEAGPGKPLPYDRRDKRQTLYMVFCRENVAIAGIVARSDRMASVAEPAYRNLILQAANEMFRSSGNDQGSLGILEFGPNPHLRLNPLEGIF